MAAAGILGPDLVDYFLGIGNLKPKLGQFFSIECRPQGPFPDGTNKHGNLMFSALVFSSRRRVMLVSNVDAEEFVLETDPKFREIALSGGIIGRGDN